MVEYLVFTTQIKEALRQNPEWAKLIRYELNNIEGITDVEFQEHSQPVETGPGTPIGCSTDSAVPHETGTGDVPNGSPSDIQSTEAVESEALNNTQMLEAILAELTKDN
jgi:hypothetical protein